MNWRTTILCLLLTLVLLLLPLQGTRRTGGEENRFLDFISTSAETASVPEPIAPYEELLRQSAEKLGWDWRLLASVIYHESRFNNDVQSTKGATGLMQIHSTRYSEDTLRIPAVNLSIGTNYLKMLDQMFDAAGPVDGLQFTLAAFNMGDGKMRRLIAKADSTGLDATRWEEVSTLLPKGHHTVSYVDKVLETFDQYSSSLPR